MAAALPDSPLPLFSAMSVLVPTALPMANAAMTNASHPKTAVFQWLALQRPIRAAMLFERFRGDMALLRKDVGLCHPRSHRAAAREMWPPGVPGCGIPHPVRAVRRRRLETGGCAFERRLLGTWPGSD